MYGDMSTDELTQLTTESRAAIRAVIMGVDYVPFEKVTGNYTSPKLTVRTLMLKKGWMVFPGHMILKP